MATPSTQGADTFAPTPAGAPERPRLISRLRALSQGASLVTRLNIVVFLCMAVIFAGVTFTTANIVRSDKEAYVFDLVSRDSMTLSAGLREALVSDPLTRTCLITDSNRPRTVNLSERIYPGLSRNPGPGEMFLHIEAPGRVMIVCQKEAAESSGGLATRPQDRPFDAQILARVDGLLGPTTFIANSSGDLVAEPQDFSNVKSNFFQNVFRTYVASGRKSGTQVVPSEDGDQIEEDINALARALYAVGSALSTFGLLVSTLFLQRFWRPIRQIKQFANALRTGVKPPPFAHRWHDEIFDIFRSLSTMSEALQGREAALRAYNDAQALLVEFARNLSLQPDLHSISALTMGFAPRILHIPAANLKIDLQLTQGAPEELTSPSDPSAGSTPACLSMQLGESGRIYGSLSIRFEGDEPGDLHKTLFQGMVRALSSAAHSLHLNAQSTSAAILQQEISTCQMIQRSIVHLDSAGPNHTLGAHYIPSSKVGGDWAGVYVDGSGAVAAYIVDVSGHGIDSAFAASIIAGVITTIHAKDTTQHPTPEEVVSTLERALTGELHKKLHFTLLILRLNPDTQTLTYANLGHHSPLVVGANGSLRKVLHKAAQNQLIGTPSEDAELHKVTVPFYPGDTVLIWKDGLLENPKIINRRLTTKWLSRELASLSHEPAPVIADKLLARASSGLEGREAPDDVCIIAIQSSGKTSQKIEPQ
jgi:serine phosphatase RsbU (regulator of sigma subunit)